MRINDKIDEILKYVDELESFLPLSFVEYAQDPKTKAACERYFEKIITAVVDLAFLVIRENGFRAPEEEREAFDTLEGEGIITEKLASRLRAAKGMRNIVAHQYGQVDDEIVFNSITKGLVNDTREFTNCVKAIISNRR